MWAPPTRLEDCGRRENARQLCMQTAGLVNARLGWPSLWRQDSQLSNPLTLLTVRSVTGQRRQKGARRSGGKGAPAWSAPVRPYARNAQQCVYCNLGYPGPGSAWWGPVMLSTMSQCQLQGYGYPTVSAHRSVPSLPEPGFQGLRMFTNGSLWNSRIP